MQGHRAKLFEILSISAILLLAFFMIPDVIAEKDTKAAEEFVSTWSSKTRADKNPNQKIEFSKFYFC